MPKIRVGTFTSAAGTTAEIPVEVYFIENNVTSLTEYEITITYTSDTLNLHPDYSNTKQRIESTAAVNFIPTDTSIFALDNSTSYFNETGSDGTIKLTGAVTESYRPLGAPIKPSEITSDKPYILGKLFIKIPSTSTAGSTTALTTTLRTAKLYIGWSENSVLTTTEVTSGSIKVTPGTTYTLTPSAATINEGAVLTSTISTTNVATGTKFYYALSGTGITTADFSAGPLTGEGITDATGKLTFSHTLANDLTTEGAESLEIKLYSDTARTLQVGSTAIVSVVDSSTTAFGVQATVYTTDLNAKPSTVTYSFQERYRRQSFDRATGNAIGGFSYDVVEKKYLYYDYAENPEVRGLDINGNNKLDMQPGYPSYNYWSGLYPEEVFDSRSGNKVLAITDEATGKRKWWDYVKNDAIIVADTAYSGWDVDSDYRIDFARLNYMYSPGTYANGLEYLGTQATYKVSLAYPLGGSPISQSFIDLTQQGWNYPNSGLGLLQGDLTTDLRLVRSHKGFDKFFTDGGLYLYATKEPVAAPTYTIKPQYADGFTESIAQTVRINTTSVKSGTIIDYKLELIGTTEGLDSAALTTGSVTIDVLGLGNIQINLPDNFTKNEARNLRLSISIDGNQVGSIQSKLIDKPARKWVPEQYNTVSNYIFPLQNAPLPYTAYSFDDVYLERINKKTFLVTGGYVSNYNGAEGLHIFTNLINNPNSLSLASSVLNKYINSNSNEKGNDLKDVFSGGGLIYTLSEGYTQNSSGPSAITYKYHTDIKSFDISTGLIAAEVRIFDKFGLSGAVSSDGYLYLVGGSEKGPYLEKRTLSGSLVGEILLGGGALYKALSVAIDLNGNVVVSGISLNTINGVSSSGFGCFISKYTNNLQHQWTTRPAGFAQTRLTIDGSNAIIAMTFDNTLNTILGIDYSGNEIFRQTFAFVPSKVIYNQENAVYVVLGIGKIAFLEANGNLISVLEMPGEPIDVVSVSKYEYDIAIRGPIQRYSQYESKFLSPVIKRVSLQPELLQLTNVSELLEGKTTNLIFDPKNIGPGTALYWSNSGEGVDGDFDAYLSSPDLFSRQSIVDKQGLLKIDLYPKADGMTEGDESLLFQFFLDTNQLDKVGESLVMIRDTSKATPIYALTLSSTSIDEGLTLTTIVATTNVDTGTKFYYALSGTGITTADFSAGALTGEGITDATGKFTFTHTLANDLTTEGAETLNIKLFSDSSRSTQVGTTASVSIADTSINPFNLDIDGDGKITALGDGLMVIRKLFGAAFAGDALTNKAMSPSSTRTTAEIHEFIQQGMITGLLDVDKDAKTTALGDGLMVIRHLFGAAFANEALTNKAISPSSPYFGPPINHAAVASNIDAMRPA